MRRDEFAQLHHDQLADGDNLVTYALSHVNQLFEPYGDFGRQTAFPQPDIKIAAGHGITFGLHQCKLELGLSL